MDEARKRVAALIRDAFEGVTLGDGVGLVQGQALDDYADGKEVAACRARDEKEYWGAIAAADLSRCHSSLSFFDAEGMRFHLPAFLLAELEGRLSIGVIFHLVQLDDYAKSKLALLSPAQRGAVREFLALCARDPDYEYERPQIERALREYWEV